MRFHIELIFILKALKSRFKGSYDKQNLSYEFMKLAEGLFHKFHMKWPLVEDPLYLLNMYLLRKLF